MSSSIEMKNVDGNIYGVVTTEQDIEEIGDFVLVPVKHGHKFCGCCCDVRIAVIVVNTIDLILKIQQLSTIAWVSLMAKSEVESVTDDAMHDSLEQSFDAIRIGRIVALALPAIGLLCDAIGIWGAVKFNMICVAISAFHFVLTIIISALFWGILSIFVIIAPSLYLYPNIVLLFEIRSGTMTPNTYKTREKSCCCCDQK